MKTERNCENCAHRRSRPDKGCAVPGERCYHPSVRLVGIRVLLDPAGTCQDHQFAREVKEG